MVHFDRGSQIRSTAFARVLANNGLVGSMGRVASSVNNGMIESIGSSRRRELLDQQHRATKAELDSAIVEWIETFYSPR